MPRDCRTVNCLGWETDKHLEPARTASPIEQCRLTGHRLSGSVSVCATDLSDSIWATGYLLMVHDSHRLDLNSTPDCTMNGGVRFGADDTQRRMYERISLLCKMWGTLFVLYKLCTCIYLRGCISGGVYVPYIYMPGESYRRQLRSLLLYLCYVFRALMNSLVRWLCICILERSLTFWAIINRQSALHFQHSPR